MTTSPFGPLAVIVDPDAAGGRVGGRLSDIRRAIEATGLDHRLDVASAERPTQDLATAALDDGLRYLAVAGDDGSVHDAVNGMFRDGRVIAEDAVVGVVPAGADGDLIRTFGLPGDVDASVRHLLGDNRYPFDLMKIAVTGPGGNTIVRYAHNVAEVGFHAAAWERMATLPSWLGGARRFVGFWGAYATNRVRDLRLVTDRKEHELRGWSVVVGNGQFTQGGLRLSPRSYPGDGVLDLLAFIGPKSQAYRMLPRLFRHGDHIPDPQIKELRVKLTVRVEADRPMPVVADGRHLGSTPVTFQVVPQQISLKL